MNLNQWFLSLHRTKRGHAERKMAAECGVLPQTVRRWRYQLRKTPGRYWITIQKVSGGKITLNELAVMASQYDRPANE